MPTRSLLILLASYVLYCAWSQGHLLAGALLLVVLAVAATIVRSFTSALLLWILPLLFVVLWAAVVGSRHPILDLVVSWAMASISIRVERRISLNIVGFYPSTLDRLIGPPLQIVLIWGALSVADILLERAMLPLNQPRSSGISGLAVALSGGGYRAALMHAGVLDSLTKLGLEPSTISCVSGGCIMGAYYVAGGAPMDFLQAVIQRRLMFSRDLFNLHNVLRLPFPFRVPATDLELFPWYRFSRSDVQARLLDRVLFGGKRMNELPAHPKLLINSTDLASGRSFGFSADGVFSYDLTQPWEKRPFVNGRVPTELAYLSLASQLGVVIPDYLPVNSEMFPAAARVAQLVVASGAFPVAFGPMDATISVGDIIRRKAVLQLADGGLTDNSGVNLLLEASWFATQHKAAPDWVARLVISSDAGAFAGYETAHSTVGQFSRAIDIVYSSVSSAVPLLKRAFEHEGFPPVILLSPANYRPDTGRGLVERALLLEQTTDVEKLNDTLWAEIERSRIAPRFENLKKYPRYMSLLKEFRSQPWGLDSVDLAGISHSVRRGFEFFLLAPTLDDTFPAEVATRLFRLGQLLVLLEAPLISDCLNNADHPWSTRCKNLN